MAIYEFRLLGVDDKVVATRECNCATLQEAINMSTTFPISYHFVEVWSFGKVIGRWPKSIVRSLA
jgi:hypothetical protein